MTTNVDRRVCFVGDSYVAGVGDADWLGHSASFMPSWDATNPSCS